ncbi:MAG TPA: biopolymer transporter ExbD [Saprospiraceae bacterium]|jgi:biopolymer transport protein ExbD|nr:biopolymer transporter ExbD [Saprospiraceae bacterium]HRO08071.1 biopolymer transporter ExbD [Saprospiraceae bacterium]HRO72349.1 biopolymer transporter ExbD [Saprospiraceae bacterium]HRP41342.1 biopolymer transporter ExbD [Saprospiraceae bacterium]
MAKAKIARKSTIIDMTAMCDVGFLLLTFFILTTKFRPQEVTQIDLPASTAQFPLPDVNVLKFDISKDGKVFFGLDDQHTRLDLLDRIAEEYKFDFNEDQKKAFKTIELWGVNINDLPSFLSMDPSARSNFVQPGLKLDSLETGGDHQVENLITWSRYANPELRIAIKGDKSTSYKSFDMLIQALQRCKVNKFNIITTEKRVAQ